MKAADCFIVGSTGDTCLNSDPVPCKGVELDVIGDRGPCKNLTEFLT